MKIIFDNEKQKKSFLEVLADSVNKCPGHCNLKELPLCDECTPSSGDNCARCWEQCGIEMVIMEPSSYNVAWKHQVLPNRKVYEKPPLGVMPRDVWDRNRQVELAEAMKRYLEAGKKIPREWIDEYNEISDRWEKTNE